MMALTTHAQIVSEILAALKATEPDVDVSIGSFTHKLADAFGEVLHEASLDRYLHGYTYDIDAKSGADLDEFVRVFGFSRLPAQRSYGQITFSRTGSSLLRVNIPQGTQVSTSNGVTVATVVSASLVVGDTTLSVPAVAVVGGTRGNVATGTLINRKTPLDGISVVTNLSSFTGGTDGENDAHLRKRFRTTVFRNIAGTEQNFLGVSLDNVNVTQANVVGASKRWRERVEVIGGLATSTVPDAIYVYDGTSVVGSNIQIGQILGLDMAYSFNSTNLVNGQIKPIIASLDGNLMPNGIYDLEFEYVPKSSRNKPTSGLTNKVDIYVKGNRPVRATESLIFNGSRSFNDTTTNPYYRQNFQRATTEAVPVAGNFFVPLTFVPVIDPSTIDSIAILGASGGLPVTYNEGTHFYLVHNITSKGLSPRSLDGIEIVSNANGSGLVNPMAGASFGVDYVYDAVPSDIEQNIRNWRMVGQDCWVHAAKMKRLRLYFAVQLQYGLTKQQIEIDLQLALSKHIDSIGFNNVLQASDLLQVAHNVDGVDAVRFQTNVDNSTNFAVQRVNTLGTVLDTYASATTPRRALDVIFGDDEIPVLDSVSVIVKAENSWGSV